MSERLVRLTAAIGGREVGAIDGPELTVWATEDGEIQVSNGMTGLSGPIIFGWEDLVPDFQRGEQVSLHLEIIESE